MPLFYFIYNDFKKIRILILSRLKWFYVYLSYIYHPLKKIIENCGGKMQALFLSVNKVVFHLSGACSSVCESTATVREIF